MNSAPGPDAAGLPPGYPFRPELEVTPRDAARLAASGSAVMIDCRTDAEHQAARIEQAVHIPLHDLEQRLGEIEDRMADRGDARVVVFCHHGVRSLKAVLLLRERGIEAAFSLAGGIDAWSLAVDRGVPRYERGPFGVRVLPG